MKQAHDKDDGNEEPSSSIKQAHASMQQPTEGDNQTALVVRNTDSEPIPTDDILMHDKGEGDRAKVCAIVPFKDTAEKDKNPFDQHLGTEYVLNFVTAKSKLAFVANPSSTKVGGQGIIKGLPKLLYKKSTNAT